MLFFKAFSKKKVSPPVTTTIKSSFSFLNPDINECTSAKIPCSTPEKIEESVSFPINLDSPETDNFGSNSVN